MTPDEAQTRRRWLLDSLAAEDEHMRRIAAAIPDDRLDWRPPGDKLRPLGALAIHAARGGRWFMRMVDGLPPPEQAPAQPADKAELLTMIEAEQAHFREHLGAYPVETLAACSDLGGAEYAHIDVLGWHRDHLIHHRAQVGLYLRLMGARVPSTYGPSGDA